VKFSFSGWSSSGEFFPPSAASPFLMMAFTRFLWFCSERDVNAFFSLSQLHVTPPSCCGEAFRTVRKLYCGSSSSLPLDSCPASFFRGTLVLSPFLPPRMQTPAPLYYLEWFISYLSFLKFPFPILFMLLFIPNGGRLSNLRPPLPRYRTVQLESIWLTFSSFPENGLSDMRWISLPAPACKINKVPEFLFGAVPCCSSDSNFLLLTTQNPPEVKINPDSLRRILLFFFLRASTLVFASHRRLIHHFRESSFFFWP